MHLSKLAAARSRLGVSELNVSSIVERLAQAQAFFLRVAGEIPDAKWNTKIEAEKWSSAEVVAHLVLVERAVIDRAERVIQKVPLHFKPWERAHLPLKLVEARLIRRQSPIQMDPTLIKDQDEMLRELRATRESTLTFLETSQGRDLSVYRWRHAFLGSLNLYEWMYMLAAHEIRHAKQVKEIARSLPKVVENS
jgi:DinB superfamily